MSFSKFVFRSLPLLLLAGSLRAEELPSSLTTADALLPKDLSPWGMFMGADWVVKGVLISLLVASILTWTIWLVKFVEVRLMGRQLDRAVVKCRQADMSLERLAADGLSSHQSEFINQVNEELALADSSSTSAGIKERIESRLTEIENTHNQQLTQGTGILASIGSTAPFVGLFGTVWGIMNSFIGISQANTTNLAVVAPGIAEALLATAMGLIAAIPAVVLYNFIVRRIANYRTVQRQFCLQIVRLVSRQLEHPHDVAIKREKHEAA